MDEWGSIASYAAVTAFENVPLRFEDEEGPGASE